MANGDDFPSAVFGGKDWGGGMYSEPEEPPTDDDDDDVDVVRQLQRRPRRQSRAKFRVERKARRVPR